MKMKMIALAGAAAILSLGLAGNAAAGGDGAALYKSKSCFTCHGADAKTPIMPVYPKLAGQNKDYLANQMKDIKSGARNNGQTAAMKGIMAGVSDAEIVAIAEYLSGL